MKNNQYVMYLWQVIERRRKEKEDRKKMMQNQESDLDHNEKREKNQHDSIEKGIHDKEKKKVINVLEVAKPGATVYDFLINTKIGVSSVLKSVQESPNEPAKEDAGTSPQQNDVVQSSSEAKQQKISEEDVGTFDQQYDVVQEKRQKHQVNDDEDATLMEVPISFIGFEESKADVSENEMIPKNMHYQHTHTFEQRRKNWIIKNTSRRDGSTIDYVYHHLETNKKFRSLVEVYKFVVHGDVRETKKKFSEYEETLQVTPKCKPRVQGKKLIKHYVVGTCTESSNGIYIKNRGEVNYLREIPSNIETKRKRENEDLYGHQQLNLGDDATPVNIEDATLSTPIQSFLYLWDFELIQQKQRPIEVIPIPNIEDSEGKDPLIGLLSYVPKATGKGPYKEDEASNKLKKRKHIKRGQDQKDILEAQRRSRVDEELRLDELRARAGGASSSVVPIQVNMIRGVNVAMESQTLTSIPPATEQTLEALLSVLATNEATVNSFGAIEAPSLLPDSEA